MIVAGVMCGLSAVGAAPAAACDNSNHCYGYADLNTGTSGGSGFHGGSVVLRTNCAYEANYSTEFIDNEEWVNFPGGYWIEAGDTTGPPTAGSSLLYFWASNRPNGGGYNEHYNGAGPGLNNYFGANIQWSSGTLWNISVGSLSGGTDPEYAPAGDIETGLETNTDHAHNYGSSSGMSYWTRSDTLHSGWNASIGNASLVHTGLGFVNWASVPTWIQMGENSC